MVVVKLILNKLSMNKPDKEREQMIILVYSIKEESKEEGIKASKEVICPKCKEDCLIDMSNYRIK